MLAHPQIVERIRMEGHTLAYHGFDHKRNSKRSIQEIKQDISRAKEELRTKFAVLERRIDEFKNVLGFQNGAH